MFSLNWLFGFWTVDIASEILSFSSKCLYVVVLLHFEKAEFALEGIRQFFVAGEMEEMKWNAFCDVHETPWYGSLCIPRDCWSRFGCRDLPLFLGMDAQGTLESWSGSNLAKKPESVNARKWMVNFAKFKLECLYFWCLDSAIWLTWYPSCLLVTVWLERSRVLRVIPDFSV